MDSNRPIDPGGNIGDPRHLDKQPAVDPHASLTRTSSAAALLELAELEARKPAENIGVAMARKCSTDSLLQALSERDTDLGIGDVQPEALAEVERLRAQYEEHAGTKLGTEAFHGLQARGLDTLPSLVREVAARRATGVLPAEVNAAVGRVVLAAKALGPVRAGKTLDFYNAVLDLLAALASKPVERTPKAVLAAMLKASETAALSADIAYYRTKPDVEAAERALETVHALNARCSDLRKALCAVVAWDDMVAIEHLSSDLRDDYQARLSGTRDLDAPPMEV